MQRVVTIAELRNILDAERTGGAVVGLVPTMGALHAGHGSLVRAAAAACDVVVATIFVNPLQFAPTEDLAAYPRDLAADTAIATEAGADYLFTPTVEEMYPDGPARVFTSESVRSLTSVLEGAERPGHFDGVATVVAKLLAITGSCMAYFGEKDFQQLAVVRRMARDLSFQVQVVGCPTVREVNGLAMSSRNRYLTAEERERAAVIYRSLAAGAAAVAAGVRSADSVTAAMVHVLATEPLVQLQYAALVDPDTFRAPEEIGGTVRLLIAARVGRARLIDNVGAVAPTR